MEEVSQEKVTPEAAAEKTFTQAEVTEMIQQYVNRVVAKAHKEAEKNKKEDVKPQFTKGIHLLFWGLYASTPFALFNHQIPHLIGMLQRWCQTIQLGLVQILQDRWQVAVLSPKFERRHPGSALLDSTSLDNVGLILDQKNWMG